MLRCSGREENLVGGGFHYFMLRGFIAGCRSLCRTPVALYSSVNELPELTNARKLFKEGNIAGSLAELDRAEQICKNISDDNPIYFQTLTQRYWILRHTVSQENRKHIPSVLENISKVKFASPSILAWKQLFHESILLSSDNRKADSIMEDIKNSSSGEENENLLRFAFL